MSQKELSEFIVEYIGGRKQTKLDDFDKKAAKRLNGADATLESQILQERRELEKRYETRAWLTHASNRVKQINLVTHPAKFTNGYSKSSSILSQARAAEGYLSTSTLANPAVDIDGNSAVLDVGKLLQTEIDGDSLWAYFQRGDYSPLKSLSENDEQLALWIEGFSRALTTKQPTSHKLAKQVYVPVGDGYHLLNPLFSSSLAQAIHQRMVALRFSEESKAVWLARRDKKWHSEPQVIFPNTATMKFGGSNQQNISGLNKERLGRVWLLSSSAPQWEIQDKAPVGIKTIFGQGPFERNTRQIRRRLTDLLIRTGDYNNVAIRRQRDSYMDEIIDILFNVAADIQRSDWAGWTQSEKCQLKAHQKLWLDPWRAKTDESFFNERDKDEWQELVADDFALWLNSHLRRAELKVGQTERREWQTKPLFRRRLREMEQAIRRYHDA